MSLSVEEFDEFFWRRGDLDVPYTDGLTIDVVELAAYRASQNETATVYDEGNMEEIARDSAGDTGT